MRPESPHIAPMQTAPPQNDKIALIACGVLALDFRYLAEHWYQQIEMHFLPGGLHKTPVQLRARLQETIDRIDATHAVARIVVGYGLCGHGTTGLRAGNLPLVIPRVHDCIALFLGSDADYREQFGKAPGTYYLSAGWVEEKHDTANGMGSIQPGPGDQDIGTAAQDAEQAAYIKDFMQSWTRNYTRSAFIDTGVGGSKEQYAEQARNLARQHGWQYERIPGTHALLHEALTCTATTETMLFVPPHSVTSFDALHGCLTCTRPGDPAAAPPDGATIISTQTPQSPPQQRGLGIGIDAGGTYTDAVLYDFDTRTVLQTHKALTTHWDYSHGIQAALAGLDPVRCRSARLVAISTTIATNAIVEHRGQTVGLLVMPPCGWTNPEGFQHQPVAMIHGQMAIDGTEREPVQPDEVRAIARQWIKTAGVTAFAVGGYAAHVNAAHELQVKRIVQEATGLICTCSHELSNSLHYRIRAETAALNARIIPCLEELLQRITQSLQQAGIGAPIMVVRSDGSFMSLQAACERPLETMLSGPAASAAGAGWLAGVQDGLIVDIGGTTTDTAILRQGEVALNPEGASIGGWQTHIRALDLQTAGLGGDSCIRSRKGGVSIGPDRVIPLSWASLYVPQARSALAQCTQAVSSTPAHPEDWLLLLRTRKSPQGNLTAREQQILETLGEQPRTPADLALRLGVPHAALLPLQTLLQQQCIAYCGFTPTDALHVSGDLTIWDTGTVQDIACACAGPTGNPAAWARHILTRFEDLLAAAIGRKALSEAIPGLAQDGLEAVLQHLVAPPGDTPKSHARLKLQLPWPVIGIGAPAAIFTPTACDRLQARCIIPPHADVANAVGAIIGTISIRHTITISNNERGIFQLAGATDAPRFSRIEEATEWAVQYLQQHLEERAQRAGCPQPTIRITPEDRMVPTTDGPAVFVGRTLHGCAYGHPHQV